MIRRLIVSAVCLFALAPSVHAEHALRVSAGFGGGVTSLENQQSGTKALSGFVAASLPVRPALRAALEVGYAGYTPNLEFFGIPEVSLVRRQGTGVLTVVAGLEWQAPRDGVWGPFVHASTGIANVSEGDSFWSDMITGAFRIPGERRNVSLSMLGLGVRHDPDRHRGPGLFADSRVSWTAEPSSRRIALYQLLGGFTS